MSLAVQSRQQRTDDIVRRLREVKVRIEAMEACADAIAQAAERMVACIKAGKKVMFCGNGGSAADSQHLAAELMGRYLRDRNPLPALALTVDTSALTAIGNDYGYEHIFSRQLRGIGAEGDVLVGLSTSGNSENVVQAFRASGENGITTVALTGQGGGRIAQLADIAIRVPATQANAIQELHIVVGHMLCGYVEDEVC